MISGLVHTLDFGQRRLHDDVVGTNFGAQFGDQLTDGIFIGDPSGCQSCFTLEGFDRCRDGTAVITVGRPGVVAQRIQCPLEGLHTLVGVSFLHARHRNGGDVGVARVGHMFSWLDTLWLIHVPFGVSHLAIVSLSSLPPPISATV